MTGSLADILLHICTNTKKKPNIMSLLLRQNHVMNTERHVYWCYSSVVSSLLLVRIRRPCDRLICWGGTSIGPENRPCD